MWLWEAFNTLSKHGRTGGFGPAHIRMEAIESYCGLLGYNDEERRHIAVVVLAMDEVWFDWAVVEQRKAESRS